MRSMESPAFDPRASFDPTPPTASDSTRSIVGWRHGPASSARAVGATVTIYVIGVHLLTFGMSRFRLPLAPLLAVGAGLALATPLAWRDLARNRRALVPTLALLAILAACWWGRAGHLFHEPLPDEPRPIPGRMPGEAI